MPPLVSVPSPACHAGRSPCASHALGCASTADAMFEKCSVGTTRDIDPALDPELTCGSVSRMESEVLEASASMSRKETERTVQFSGKSEYELIRTDTKAVEDKEDAQQRRTPVPRPAAHGGPSRLDGVSRTDGPSRMDAVLFLCSALPSQRCAGHSM